MMITDTELKINGFMILSEKLGEVEMERFIGLLQRDKFDYTKWRKNLWPNVSIKDLSEMAMETEK